MREQKWNLGRFIGRSSALLLLFALLFLPSARAEEGENLPKIIIGSDEYQPYSYYNVDGSPQGVDVEMAREAFRRMGYAPVFRHVAWEDKDEALADGTVDCLWSGFMMNNCARTAPMRIWLIWRAAARRFRRRAGRNIS